MYLSSTFSRIIPTINGARKPLVQAHEFVYPNMLPDNSPPNSAVIGESPIGILVSIYKIKSLLKSMSN